MILDLPQKSSTSLKKYFKDIPAMALTATATTSKKRYSSFTEI